MSGDSHEMLRRLALRPTVAVGSDVGADDCTTLAIADPTAAK
ncbi:hypothetical protein [Brevibacterium sp. JSBI002]|nr:hypothetical protein [Brevibacterium sp. JSBI002]UZD61907.1 hypothetical protein LJ362_14755 [Brevibacterium sp. JSBI002]